ncbi:hypothetical protein ACFQKF_09040 [Halalkalicoccus sp. GCM10025322]|uniref:hypothetical protein n=1 Tax=Halalkalicoccus TaxID=332246 RepID=UPI002F9663D3
MVDVTYYCPHCGTIAEIERDAYLADRSVTSYPLEGWEYATPDEEYESADGVRFICGESETPRVSFRRPPPRGDGPSREDRDDVGCGEAFYLSFVRFEDGEEIDPEPPAEYVEIGTGTGPRGPRGPRSPGGSR